MIKPTKALPHEPLGTPEPAARTLAQEKLDFTAEGSPPPGQVAGTGVAGTQDASSRAKRDGPGRRQPPAPAGPARRTSKRSPAAWGGNR